VGKTGEHIIVDDIVCHYLYTIYIEKFEIDDKKKIASSAERGTCSVMPQSSPLSSISFWQRAASDEVLFERTKRPVMDADQSLLTPIMQLDGCLAPKRASGRSGPGAGRSAVRTVRVDRTVRAYAE
jgi:hypothetical protein